MKNEEGNELTGIGGLIFPLPAALALQMQNEEWVMPLRLMTVVRVYSAQCTVYSAQCTVGQQLQKRRQASRSSSEQSVLYSTLPCEGRQLHQRAAW